MALGNNSFDIGDVVSRAWELLKKNVGVAAATTLIPLGIDLMLSVPELIADLMAENSGERDPGLALALALLTLSLLKMMVSLYLQLGATRIYANLAAGRPVRVGMLFEEGARIPAMIVATLIVGVGTVFGLLLLVVPGIILSLGLGFYVFGLVDQDLGPIKALQESWRLTTGHKAFLFLFFVLAVILGLLAVVLTCGLGVLLVLPMLLLSQAVLYQAMVDEKGRAAAM